MTSRIQPAQGRGKKVVLGLVLVSGVCGLLLSRYFTVYALLPAVFVLLAAVYFGGQADGLMKGILAFVFSLIAMQGCFLIGATIRVFRNNFAPTRAPSEYFLALPPDNPERGGGGSFAL